MDLILFRQYFSRRGASFSVPEVNIKNRGDNFYQKYYTSGILIFELNELLKNDKSSRSEVD